MSAMESLYRVFKINSAKFSRNEIQILEGELFDRVYNELMVFFKSQNTTHVCFENLNKDKEKAMIEDNFARCVINDILSTEEYTLPGIARYTQMPEDVIYDVITGRNTSPSAKFVRRVIELHRSVRKDLYKSILNKIISGIDQT